MGKKIMSVKNGKIVIHITIIAIMLFFTGCHPKSNPDSKYGIAYNYVRDSLGIKLIPDDWTISRQSKDLNGVLWVYYTNPCIDSTEKELKVYYSGKTLEIRNDSLIHEADDYIIVRFSESNESIVEKGLSYHFTYCLQSNHWPKTYHYYFINSKPDGQYPVQFEDGRTRRDSLGELLPMTRAEADSILATWGMKYP